MKKNRNSKGYGTIRHRSDGRWEARFSCGFDPKTGKQIQKSIYGKTQKEVKERLAATIVQIDNGVYIEPCSIKMVDWLDMWTQDYIGNVKSSTVKSYEDHIKLNIVPYIGNVELTKLTPFMIQRMYNKLLNEKELSPKTVKNVHGVMHRALEQAKKLQMINYNPTDAVVLPRIEKKQIKPMEDEELILFLNAIKGSPYETVFFVAVFTGLRQAEVLGLTWDCVNFQNNLLFINKQHAKDKITKEYQFSSLKNDKPRTIEAAPAVMDVLRQQKQQQDQWDKDYAGIYNNTENLVFTTETGRYLCNQTVYLAFKKVVKSLGLENVRFHDLRHTYAVNSLKSGDDIKTVQGNLGHHTASFTLDTYGHVTAGMRHSSASHMEQYIHTVISYKGSK